MNYLALGDSISIDDYTGRPGGGAASQFAKLIGATSFLNLTQDGITTVGLLDVLDEVDFEPQIVTLTIGGNDLLQLASEAANQRLQSQSMLAGQGAELILGNFDSIAEQLADFGCTVIVNTIYDPTDGDDALAAQMGIDPAWRKAYDQVNAGITAIAAKYGFLLCDLETLFHGHGTASAEPWFVMQIEPNLSGATAIAGWWRDIYEAKPK